MDYEIKRLLATLSIIPIIYALGYHNGKKKGDGMLKLANEVSRKNAEQVNRLNSKINEINRAYDQIRDWEKEHFDEF